MLSNVIVAALLIFAARVLSIAISTVRTVLMTRGNKILSSVLGFFEALLFALTIAQVVQNLDNTWNLMAYSAGFAGGVLLGLALEERLAMGYATVNIVSTHKAREVAEEVRKEGFGATEIWGQGSEGEVGLVRTVVPRRQVRRVSDLVNDVDPSSFITIEDTLAVRRGYLGLMPTRS
jgi:uncharacterized protein YebE (UPF0316 family)